MGEDAGLGLRFGAGVLSQRIAPAKDEEQRQHEEDGWEEDEHDEYEQELPIISIELARLVGYKPSTMEEVESIKKQLIEAMWMRYKSSNNNSNNNNNSENGSGEGKDDEEEAPPEEEPPPDFDDQIKELLDSRVARFGCPDAGYSEETDATADNEPSQGNTVHGSIDSPVEPPFSFLEISYPSRVLPPLSHPSTQVQTATAGALQDTAVLWKEIRSLAYALDHHGSSEEEIAFWYHLSDHLEHTGRMLSWKHGMALELKDLLFRENLHKNHQLWVREQRTAKLEQLYQVRETLVHRKEVAQDDYDRLVQTKNTLILRDMNLYDHACKRKNKSANGDNANSLFGGSGLSFPEEFELMGLLPKDSQLYEEEDWGGTLDDEDDFDYYNSDYSNDYSDDYSDLSGFSGDEEGGGDDHEELDSPRLPIAPLPEPANLESTADHPKDKDDALAEAPATAAPLELDGVGREPPTALGSTSVPKPFLKRNRARRKKKARAQKKRELAAAKRKEEREQRRAHEALLEAQHTTNELVLAQTLLEALAKKVRDVEDLLENLQDEEWAAEEEAEKKEQQQQQQEQQDSDSNDTNKLSLLDQILAMILGALPMQVGSTDKEGHFRYVKEEHEFIVEGWKKYFGRLPPAHVPGAKPTPAEPNERENEFQTQAAQAQQASGGRTGRQPRFRAPPPATAVKLSKITSRKASPATASATSTAVAATPQEQRMALGIVDNEDGDWDAMADDDDE